MRISNKVLYTILGLIAVLAGVGLTWILTGAGTWFVSDSVFPALGVMFLGIFFANTRFRSKRR